MARASVDWTREDLAREAGVTAQTIWRYETGGNATVDTLIKLKEAFERAGCTWVPENGGPATVRPPREKRE